MAYTRQHFNDGDVLTAAQLNAMDNQIYQTEANATRVEESNTNGNVKINGAEKNVYTHPGSGSNPHGTTKNDVGLGNVGNYKAVSTAANQALTEQEKSNARANIGADLGLSIIDGKLCVEVERA